MGRRVGDTSLRNSGEQHTATCYRLHYDARKNLSDKILEVRKIFHDEQTGETHLIIMRVMRRKVTECITGPFENHSD